jgi:Wzt C-terminal domain
LCMRVRFLADVEDPVFAMALTDMDGRVAFAASTEWEEGSAGTFSAGESVDVALSFDNWFAPGRYEVSGRILHRGAGRRIMAEQDGGTSFVVTGSRAGGGAIDVPHAFHLTRAGAAAQQLT